MRTPTHPQSGSVIVTLLVCLTAAFVLCSCKKSPEQKIVGTWNVDGKQSVVEYRKDGTFVTTENGKSTPGTYRFTDDTHLELSVGGVIQGTTNTMEFKLPCEIVFHGDKADLTVNMPGNAGAPAVSKTIHYTRAN